MDGIPPLYPMRAFVAGYTSEIRQRGLFAMLQAYIDESGKGGSKDFILAGYVASVDRWISFENEWSEALLLPPRIDNIKDIIPTSERDIDIQRMAFFRDIIHRHAQFGAICAIDANAYSEIFNNTEFPKRLHRPLLLAVTSVVDMIAKTAYELGLPGIIEFTFDSMPEGEFRRITGWWERELPTMHHLPYLHKITKFPRQDTDDRLLPLQAAHVLACLSRRSLDDLRNGRFDERLDSMFPEIKQPPWKTDFYNKARLYEVREIWKRKAAEIKARTNHL